MKPQYPKVALGIIAGIFLLAAELYITLYTFTLLTGSR